MKTRIGKFGLALAFSTAAWFGAFASQTSYVMERLNVVPMADTSRMERRLLDAVLEGRLSEIDLMLSSPQGNFGINAVLCFHEASENPFVADNEDAFQPYELRTADLVPGVNMWLERDGFATHGELLWRTYPKAVLGSCPYGYARLYGTALMIAARNRDAQMVQALLKRGAAPNVFVRLGNGEMMYAAKEAYRGASSERDKAKAREILKLLAAANAQQPPGDSLANAPSPRLPTAFANKIGAHEADRLEASISRRGKRDKAWTAFNAMMAAEEQRQAERDRKAAEAAENRQRLHEMRLQAVQQQADIRLWKDSGQTRGQWETSQSLGLKRVNPYGYGCGSYGDKLFKDSEGRLFEIDSDGKFRAIRK